jgi:hypothetical protein
VGQRQSTLVKPKNVREGQSSPMFGFWGDSKRQRANSNRQFKPIISENQPKCDGFKPILTKIKANPS